MSGTDTDAEADTATPAPEPQPAAVVEQPAAVPDETQNPEQDLNWSRRTRDPKDIQKK
jgi:hypothetical protein